VHAADIAVDEFGTVAAAVTALGFDESGPGEPDVTVRADKPFLYLIPPAPFSSSAGSWTPPPDRQHVMQPPAGRRHGR
jgi:hypothetical protein